MESGRSSDLLCRFWLLILSKELPIYSYHTNNDYQSFRVVTSMSITGSWAFESRNNDKITSRAVAG